MVLYNVAEIFAPMQIMVVLVLALLLFGPKRLPELGKSLGTALRDLNKAKNDMMRSFSLDHDADQPYRSDSYSSNYGNSYDSSIGGYEYNSEPAKPDLTDYTMAGVPPKDVSTVDGAVPRGSIESVGMDSYADYTIIPSQKPAESTEPGSGASAH